MTVLGSQRLREHFLSTAFRDLITLMDEELTLITVKLTTAESHTEILKLQGEHRALTKLRSQMVPTAVRREKEPLRDGGYTGN